MDLSVYLRVLWRFRVLVLFGFIFAAALAYVSLVRIELDGVRPEFVYRTPEIWKSETTLFVTQAGFPWGRAISDEVVPLDPAPTAGGYIPRFAEPERFANLAILYSHLANSDAVKRIIRADGPFNGTYKAAPVQSEDGVSFLPFIKIEARSATPSATRRLAGRASEGFRRFMEEQQIANQIPPEKRVQLPVIREPLKVTLFAGRRMTRPIFLFLLVLIATIGLAFVLENMRPRMRRLASGTVSPTPALGTARHSPNR